MDNGPAMIQIHRANISDPDMVKDFVRAGSHVAMHTPQWIPRLEMEMRDHLSSKNPYFKTAKCTLIVAYDVRHTPNPIGRISVQTPHNASQTFASPSIAHFGFPAATDRETFHRLLAAAEDIARQAGCRYIAGPYSLSMNDEVGLLVEGYDSSPRLLMNYAPPWMKTTLEDHHYQGIKDLLAYEIGASQDLPPAAVKMTDSASTSARISCRSIDLRNLHRDLGIVRNIFNRAWAKNWGFIPMSNADIHYMAQSMKMILDPDLAHIAFVDDKPAAMIVALPDINEAIRDFDGKLLPLNWIKLIWRLKIKGISSARVVLMGVEPDFQSGVFGSALSLMLISKIHHAIRDKKMETVELSWILEDNTAIKRMIESVGGKESKRYRLFEKDLV